MPSLFADFRKRRNSSRARSGEFKTRGTRQFHAPARSRPRLTGGRGPRRVPEMKPLHDVVFVAVWRTTVDGEVMVAFFCGMLIFFAGWAVWHSRLSRSAPQVGGWKRVRNSGERAPRVPARAIFLDGQRAGGALRHGTGPQRNGALRMGAVRRPALRPVDQRGRSEMEGREITEEAARRPVQVCKPRLIHD